jgi:hypothetical protein
MDIGRQSIRLIESSYAHKVYGITCSGVVAPKRDPADWTARNLLALAAVRRSVYDFGLSFQQVHAGSFDQCIESIGSPCFALTPATMTAMNEQGVGRHSIAHRAAGAAAVQWKIVVGIHGARLIVSLGSPMRSIDLDHRRSNSAWLL